MPSSAEPAALRATERWFMRRGLPMLVEEYSAGTDVWTRALPALVGGFVLLLASVQDQLQVSLLAGDPGPVVLLGHAVGRRRAAAPARCRRRCCSRRSPA